MLLVPLGVLLAWWLVSRLQHAYTHAPLPISTNAHAIDASTVCLEIASSVSAASGIFFNGTARYAQGIHHYAISSTQHAECVFEPGTPKDVGIALQILGRTKCPFAIKSGGHAMNPGFSSTLGVQITMRRFSDVRYDSGTRTAKVGAGLVWDDVYAALEHHGVNVAGGRVSGIGVGGFTLGGGYSWHANQHGLTLDTVEEFELVLPNGTVTDVNNHSHPELFFGLRGGFNNFGVVTRFTFRTFPQTQVWAGSVMYSPTEADQFTKATANFAANNTDPKANIIATNGYTRQGNTSGRFNAVTLFYDAPSPPEGLFDDFLTINGNATVFTRSFLSFLTSLRPSAPDMRVAFHTVSVPDYPEDVLRCILDETMSIGSMLPPGDGFIHFNIHPFLPNVYTHSTSPSAWPGSRAWFSPVNIALGWTGNDTTTRAMTSRIKASAESLGATTRGTKQLSLYGNYALADTPLESMYGPNVDRLRGLANSVDPDKVMGLAGGFRFGGSGA